MKLDDHPPTSTGDAMLKLVNVTKTYGHTVAVDNVCTALARPGVNGKFAL